MTRRWTAAVLAFGMSNAWAVETPDPLHTEPDVEDVEDVEEPEQDDPVEADDPAEESVVPKRKWGGMLIPLIGGNPIDGFGFGFGGEVYRRPAGQESGYDLKITPSLYVNTRFDYTNDFVRIEWQGENRWLLMVGYQQWANLSYAGAGGAAVLVDHGPAELQNRVWTPYAFLGMNRPIGEKGWSLFVQGYARWASVRPAEDGLLAELAPFGVEGGLYSDVSVGLEHRRHDRWPMPHKGHIFDVSVRSGGTATAGQFIPIAGLYVEGMLWQPLIGERLVLGTRVLLDQASGRQPFFEQDKAAGRWRDELGSEQALGGYGRTRTRGDGLFAALTELRPSLFRLQKGFFDLQFHLSLTAEIGWLSNRWDPGPPLPTLGVGLPLLWQQAVQLRPFVGWGWRSQTPEGPRRPGLQFGISVLDAL
jgi:hypothetical protein